MRNRIVSAVLSSMIAVTAAAQGIPALLKEHKIPAVGIGVIRDGKLQRVEVYGQLAEGVAAPYDTIWNVASLTKPVVALLTLKLVAEGKWSLDEPLAKHWVDPDVANDPRHKKLTTRHVLSHQTGFKNWRWLEESKKLTFNADPGTKFGYSGEGFEYLRRALEQKLGKSLAQLSQTYVFDAAGMPDTRHLWDARMDEARFARWHDGEGRNTYTDHRTTKANAADDLLTTVEDYGRFAAWVLNGAGLPPALFNEMLKQQATMRPGAAFSLGWELIQDLPNGEYALIHSGSDEGVKTLVILLPRSKQGVVVLTNGDNGVRLYPKLITDHLDVGAELLERAN
ncbi:MAG TPA: serine hydrolase domain-containing protein [Thermoanaerobaculia bacterium]